VKFIGASRSWWKTAKATKTGKQPQFMSAKVVNLHRKSLCMNFEQRLSPENRHEVGDFIAEKCGRVGGVF